MKRLLNEDTTRKFMKLANLKPHTESFLDKVEEGKAGDTDRKDIANIIPDAGQLKEEEEVSEDTEITEEAEVTEEGGMAYARDDEEEEPMGEPMDDLPPAEEPMDDSPDDLDPETGGAGGDLDVTAIVQAVTDALAQELDSQGHAVDIDVEGGEGEDMGDEPMDDAPMDDAPMDDAPMDDAPEEPAGEEEDPVLEDFESAGITVEGELDEEYLNEITRRVAQRLLEKTKNNQ